MKRRLDLALALVHEPRILFLDEPTTGLDPQSRAALWEEVARLAHDEGMTVFLTTQYLEEADALADRIGIIDHGTSSPRAPPRSSRPKSGARASRSRRSRPDAGDRLAELLQPVRRAASATAGARVTVQLPGGEAELAEIVRVLDSADLRVETLQLHQPSLDDVFLAKTGRKLEGAGAEMTRAKAGSRARTGRRLVRERASREQTRRHRRRQRALLIFPMLFPADPVRDQRHRAQHGDRHPGLPDPQLPRLPASRCRSCRARCSSRSRPARASHATSRRGFLNRLALTPAARRGAAARAARRGARARRACRRSSTCSSGSPPGSTSPAGSAACWCCSLLSLVISFAFASLGGLLALRLGSGEAVQGIFPLLFVTLFLSSVEPAAQPDQGDLVSRRRHLQPGLLPDRGAAQPRDHRLERAGARARVRLRAGAAGDLARAARGPAMRSRLART